MMNDPMHDDLPHAPHPAPVSKLGSHPYDHDIVGRVWCYGQVIPGNDPELWRKDEFGAWIHRLEFGNRRCEFGWEILDLSLGRGNVGVTALRPAQWQNYIDQVAAHTQSRITAN